MVANYEYILKWCKSHCASGRILDYGCGAGEIVLRRRDKGLDICGVEAFHGGNSARDLVASKGLLGVSVFELSDQNTIPFPDETFDLIVSNQVMEHVQDMDQALKEISRVLKHEGKLITLFPTFEIIRECHCGILFAHRFSRCSKWRYPYMRFMRGLGFGYRKEGKTKREWVRYFMGYMDNYTYYRKYTDIYKLFNSARFGITHNEERYIEYRLSLKGIKVPKIIRDRFLWKAITRKFCRIFGSVVMIATKTESGTEK